MITETSQIREEIESHCTYLLRNKMIKSNELQSYVKYLYIKWTGFIQEHFSFADQCYVEMIVDSIKSKVRTPKAVALTITETFLDYKKNH